MPIPTIAIDLDEVLSPFVTDLLVWYNCLYQTNLQLTDFTSYHFNHVWGGTTDQAVAICDHFHKSRNPKEATLIPGAQAALMQLKLRYRLIMVTSRPLAHAAYTHEWIDLHLPNVFADIVLCDHWTSSGKRIKKSAVCQKIGAKYLIDDLPAYVEDAAQCGIASLLFGDYPWNRNVIEHDHIQRVASWNEALNYLNNNAI